MTNHLPADIAALLAAVCDALDIPLPGIDDADERARTQLLVTRSARARIAVECVLAGHDVANNADWLRETTADTPVTYTPWVPPEQRDGGTS